MKTHKSQTGFTALHILLLLVILGIIGFAGWKVYDASKSNKPSVSSSTQSTSTQPQKTEYKVPNGFVEYQNKELGFMFAYPKEWGQVDFSIRDGAEGGKSFRGIFTNNSEVSFGGLSNDFQEGREYVYPETKGFILKNNQYYEHALNDTPITNFATLIKPLDNQNTKGILIKGNGKQGLYEIYTDRLMAVFNLNNKQYPGLGFSDNDQVKIPQSEFEAVLNTFTAP